MMHYQIVGNQNALMTKIIELATKYLTKEFTDDKILSDKKQIIEICSLIAAHLPEHKEEIFKGKKISGLKIVNEIYIDPVVKISFSGNNPTVNVKIGSIFTIGFQPLPKDLESE